MSFWSKLFKKRPDTDVIGQASAYEGQVRPAGWGHSFWDGSKYAGSFGQTQLQTLDYWQLRERSRQLFNENLYAKGIVNCAISNEIGPGLHPEACPEAEILGFDEDFIQDWTELVETRFNLWAITPEVCDYAGESTFYQLQAEAKREAYLAGDVLQVIHIDSRTNLPKIQLICGDDIRSPLLQDEKNRIPQSHTIVDGVELNKRGKHVAYWFWNKHEKKFERILAYGSRSGRRVAKLIYGAAKRKDVVRGQPLLSVILSSLKEIDTYRDSVQRKAALNATIVGSIERSMDRIPSNALSQGAARKDTATITNTGDNSTRELGIVQQLNGVFIEQLSPGEQLKAHEGAKSDLDFGAFESSIIFGCAWALRIPPEILLMSFNSNYSASQAALNEYKNDIATSWVQYGQDFCRTVYQEWLCGEVFNKKINAKGLLAAKNDLAQFDVFAAWTLVEWYGSVKPTTDMLKQAKGSKMLVDEGWSTNAREARVTTGTKWSRNIKRRKRENELMVEAMRPLAEFKQEFGMDVQQEEIKPLSLDESGIEDMLQEFIQNG